MICTGTNCPTVTTIYCRYTGEELKHELKKRNVRQLKEILDRFSQVPVNANTVPFEYESPVKSKTKTIKKPLQIEVPKDGDVPPVTVNSDKELQIEFEQIRDNLSDKEDWSRRNDALKHIQALLFGGASYLGTFNSHVAALKELVASQVCTCAILN